MEYNRTKDAIKLINELLIGFKEDRKDPFAVAMQIKAIIDTSGLKLNEIEI